MKYFSQYQQPFLPKSFYTLPNNNMKPLMKNTLMGPLCLEFIEHSLAKLAISINENNIFAACVIVITIILNYQFLPI